MAAFDYVALSLKGRQQKGVLEADSPRQARQILRDRQLAVLSIREVSELRPRKSGSLPGGRRLSIGTRELSALTRQLATLIAASLPVEEALFSLSRQTESAATRSVLAALRTNVMQGQSLASSLQSFPRIFSELFRTSVYAGEKTGQLGKVLEYLADYSESAHQARQKILLALLYPVILCVVSLFIIAFLLAFIVPDMVRVFAGAGQSLPLLTRGLIDLSNAVQSYGILLAVGFGAFTWLAVRSLRTPVMRLKLDKSLLSWPVVGKLMLQYNSARFASTLGMLQNSGVPLVSTLEISTAIVSNRHLRLLMLNLTQKVREGVSLSQAMQQSEVLPPVLVAMVGSGEASGTLGEMLKRASVIQQRDLENRVALLLGLFEPTVLIIMGGMMLLLVLAIILPVINLNQLVK